MNKVVFIGAGPGDPELITLKGKKWLEQADVVIYAGSLLNPEYLKYCKKGVELHDSAKMGLPEMLKVMVEGVKADKLVVRLHDGDPSFYGAIQEVMTALDKEGIEYFRIPGISCLTWRRSSTQPRINPTKHLTNSHHHTPRRHAHQSQKQKASENSQSTKQPWSSSLAHHTSPKSSMNSKKAATQKTHLAKSSTKQPGLNKKSSKAHSPT